jgi:septal ring factor EnvC (AmiA/AmiB activator)
MPGPEVTPLGILAKLRIALLAVIVSVVAPAIAAELDQKTQELSDLRSRISEHQREVQKLDSQEKGELQRLNELGKEMALTTDLLRGLAAREGALQDEIGRLEEEIGIADSRIEIRRDRLAARLRQMYKERRSRPTHGLLQAGSVNGAAVRWRWTTYLARAERSLMDEVRDAQTSSLAGRAELEQGLGEVQLMQSEAADRRQRLEELQTERESQLGQLRKTRSAQRRMLADLEASAAELEELLARLDRERLEGGPAGDGAFEALKGQLLWPTDGELIRGFGKSVHPQFKTVVVNKGIHIAAPAGSAVRAVAGGVVNFVDWLPGYGRCIILSHGGGYYTFYAHSSVVFPRKGVTIERGEIIAEVGDTGSLEGDQLYFELRKGRDALNPMDWLQRSAR